MGIHFRWTGHYDLTKKETFKLGMEEESELSSGKIWESLFKPEEIVNAKIYLHDLMLYQSIYIRNGIFTWSQIKQNYHVK